MTTRFWMMALLATVLSLGMTTTAAHADEREQLRERFKQRFPTLVQLKRAERVGETFKGLAAAVREEYLEQRVRPDDDASPTIKAFLEEENRDRQRLYQLLAEELDTTPARIAKRDARRRFDQARPEEWLQPREKVWVRKRDMQ